MDYGHVSVGEWGILPVSPTHETDETETLRDRETDEALHLESG